MAEEKGKEPEKGVKPVKEEGTTLPPSLLALGKEADEAGISVKEFIRRESQSAVDGKVRSELSSFQQWQADTEGKAQNFDEIVTSMKEAGLIAENADLNSFKSGYMAKLLTQPLPGPKKGEEDPAPEADPSPKGDAEPEDPLFIAAAKLAEEVGLLPGDEELTTVDNSGSFSEYMESIKVAGAAKRQRIADTSETPDTDPTAIDSGLGVPGEVNPIAEIVDHNELYKLALSGKSDK